jgi:hypothetical protein
MYAGYSRWFSSTNHKDIGTIYVILLGIAFLIILAYLAYAKYVNGFTPDTCVESVNDLKVAVTSEVPTEGKETLSPTPEDSYKWRYLHRPPYVVPPYKRPERDFKFDPSKSFSFMDWLTKPEPNLHYESKAKEKAKDPVDHHYWED